MGTYRGCRFPHQSTKYYAVGDVVGFPSLAWVSMEEGRLAAAIAFGIQIKSNPAVTPMAFTPFLRFRLLVRTKSN